MVSKSNDSANFGPVNNESVKLAADLNKHLQKHRRSHKQGHKVQKKKHLTGRLYLMEVIQNWSNQLK